MKNRSLTYVLSGVFAVFSLVVGLPFDSFGAFPIPITIDETIDGVDIEWLGDMDEGRASRRLEFYAPSSNKSKLEPALKCYEYVLSDTFFTICKEADVTIVSFLARPTSAFSAWIFPANTTIHIRRGDDVWVGERIFVSRYEATDGFLYPVIEDLGASSVQPLEPNPTDSRARYSALGVSAFNGFLHAEFLDDEQVEFYVVIPKKSLTGTAWSRDRERFSIELVPKGGQS